MSLGLSLGLSLRSSGGGASSPSLLLSASTVADGAAANTVIGTLSVANHPSGSSGWTFVDTVDAGGKFNVSGANLRTSGTWDYETATSYGVTITASKSGQSDITRAFTVTITNVLEVTLSALSFDDSTLNEGIAATVTISGASSGSTLALDAGSLPSGMTLNSGARTITGTPGAIASGTATIRETHPDGSNSPRSTVWTWEVVDAPSIVIDSNTVSEDADIGTLIGLLSVENHPSGSSGWTFSIDSQDPADALTLGPDATPIVAPDGYDIILTVGDSTEHGQGAAAGVTYERDVARDVNTSGVYAYLGPDAPANGKLMSVIQSDFTPLHANNSSFTQDFVAPAEELARQYKANHPAHVENPNRRVLVVPMSRAAMALTDGASTANGALAVGGSVYEAAITQFNGAVAAARIEYPGSRVAGICFTSGANDAAAGGTLNATAFQNACLAVIDDMRSRITGAAEAWVVWGGIGPSLSSTDYTTVRTATSNLPGLRTNVFKVDPTGGGTDNIHPNSAQNYQWGIDKYTAIAAVEPSTVEDFTISPKSGQALDSDIISNPVVPNVGYGVGAAWSITGGEARINGGNWATSGTYYWGGAIEVRVHSSASNSTTTSATLTVGTKSATFDVTTVGLAGTTYMRSVIPGALYFDNGMMRSVPDSLVVESA